jgi:hypothetical protein
MLGCRSWPGPKKAFVDDGWALLDEQAIRKSVAYPFCSAKEAKKSKAQGTSD